MLDNIHFHTVHDHEYMFRYSYSGQYNTHFRKVFHAEYKHHHKGRSLEDKSEGSLADKLENFRKQHFHWDESRLGSTIHQEF